MVTQERALRTRTQALEASARVFARSGYAGASYAALIEESGLTKGAFYFHFPSKEGLALATLEHKQRQLIESMTARVPIEARGLDRLVALLRARADLLVTDESFWSVLRLGGELGAVSGPGTDYSRFTEWPITLFADLLAEGRALGQVRADLDVRAVAEAVYADILGMDSLASQLTGGRDLAERTELLVTLLRAALRPQLDAPTRGDTTPTARNARRGAPGTTRKGTRP